MTEKPVTRPGCFARAFLLLLLGAFLWYLGYVVCCGRVVFPDQPAPAGGMLPPRGNIADVGEGGPSRIEWMLIGLGLAAAVGGALFGKPPDNMPPYRSDIVPNPTEVPLERYPYAAMHGDHAAFYAPAENARPEQLVYPTGGTPSLPMCTRDGTMFERLPAPPYVRRTR